MPRDPDMRERLLDAAQELCQTRGYNAFSYADLADRVGIRTASIHYHFPAKGDLGRALVERYRADIAAALSAIDVQAMTSIRKLERFAALLHDVLTSGNRMCLGGMLATEQATLPGDMQRGVRYFFAETEAWLAGVFAAGQKAGELSFEGRPAEAARVFLAALEGSMLAAQAVSDGRRLSAAARWILKNLAKPRNSRQLGESIYE